MILILSIPNDQDTQLVIDWLKFKKKHFFRVNDDDLINGKTQFFYEIGKPNQAYFLKNNKKLLLQDIDVVWYRKFRFLQSFQKDEPDLKKYMKSEFLVLSKIIFKLLSKKKWLFDRSKMASKIEILEKAIECGLTIPKSAIISSKKALEQFEIAHGSNIISKAMKEGDHIVDKHKFHYSMFTIRIDDLDKVPNSFSPSYIQRYAEKEFELRCFYLNKKIWSMAIFSQNNEKTKLDFRNYDREVPNRTEPYILPKEIHKKVIDLMESLGLNTGSIDFIKEKNGDYVFLEVNPSGQFSMTAFPCNYPLHEEVSNYLSYEDERSKKNR